MDASELLHHPAGTGTAACRSHGGVPVCAAPGVARLWSGAGGVAAWARFEGEDDGDGWCCRLSARNSKIRR